MSSHLDLPIEPAVYWLHARGEGGGADFDLVMERDDDGLPLLRGRHVAGLLRLTLHRAMQWCWFDTEEDVAELLLGQRHSRMPTTPGCLAVGDARVRPELRHALLKRPESPALPLKNVCFQRLSTTAIDPDQGVAKSHHLRTVEAALPLPLLARVSFAPEQRRDWAAGRPDDAERKTEQQRLQTAQACWRDWLAIAWPAFDEVGAKRTRGFGRLAWSELP